MSERNVEIAEFQQARPERPPLSFAARVATPDDAPAIARLDAARNGTEAAEILPRVRRDLEAAASGASARRCWVAATEDEIVGFARAAWRDFGEAPEARDLPSGWYLTGIVVSPGFRRRGIGRALTHHRLVHLAALGAEEVYSFTSAGNRVSVALHESLGFEEQRRDIVVPGVTFHGGVGVLYRIRLDAGRWRREGQP